MIVLRIILLGGAVAVIAVFAWWLIKTIGFSLDRPPEQRGFEVKSNTGNTPVTLKESDNRD